MSVEKIEGTSAPPIVEEGRPMSRDIINDWVDVNDVDILVSKDTEVFDEGKATALSDGVAEMEIEENAVSSFNGGRVGGGACLVADKVVPPVDVAGGSGATDHVADNDEEEEMEVPSLSREVSAFSMMSEDSDQQDKECDFAEETSRVIDVNELSAVVDEGESDIKNLQDKNVVLIIGKTGVGKSTLVQLLNGATVERDGHAYKVMEDASFLPDFVVGHHQASTTKCVRSYHGASDLVYCDMPGYKDTNSYTIDIATAVWINKIAKVCRSLRFVLMIHGATLEEERGTLFRDLMHMFSKLVNHQPMSVAKSVLILFTHMSDHLDFEKEESKALKYIDEKIKAIRTATSNVEAKNMMMILRTHIKHNSGNVRSLNPVTTDINALSLFIKNGMRPLEQADACVTCSLNREVELAVSYAVDKLLTAIEECLYSSIDEKQDKLLELLRLMVVFVKMLRSDTLADKLRCIVSAVAEEYRNNYQCVLEIVDSKVENISGAALLSREEVQLVIPKYRKLSILGQGVEEFDIWIEDKGELGLSTISNLQTEYYRKCLLLKIDLLGKIQTTNDYSSVFLALGNLSALGEMEDILDGKAKAKVFAIVKCVLEINIFVHPFVYIYMLVEI